MIHVEMEQLILPTIETTYIKETTEYIYSSSVHSLLSSAKQEKLGKLNQNYEIKM